jgi:hypothetical protein
LNIFEHIESIKPGSPEAVNLARSSLIPGLFGFLSENPRTLEFASYFHSLGLSLNLVMRLAASDESLKNALSVALETCILRLLNIRSGIKDVSAYINYLKSLFSFDKSAPDTSSVVVFGPHGMQDEEIASAVKNKLDSANPQNDSNN